MKKIMLFVAVVGMIAAMLAPKAPAQSISLMPYFGFNLRPKGFVLGVADGLCALKEAKGKPISFGLDLNGGIYYSYRSYDSMAVFSYPRLGLGAHAVLFVVTRNIPKSGNKFNHFFGPVAGAGIGPAYVSGRIGGAAKIFLQGNYSFGEKGNFGIFAQAHVNALLSKNEMGSVLFSPAVVAGCKFKLR